MTQLPKITPKQFQQAILTWFDQHGRKNLPWQKHINPYRVWVSEIMLQQTQVNTVIPYFLRFMEKLPTIQSLALANEDDVLHLWTGLGYYTRARNLHQTAKTINKINNGRFPEIQSELENLPGIGRSTAAAILAIAFQKKAAILDGNVKRVLTRFLAIQAWPGEKDALEQLWHYAEKYTPSHRIADYTQAMMDLGATICLRSKPKCAACPLQKHCLAYSLGIQNQLPLRKPPKKLPERETTFLIIRKNKEILLEKRAPTGIWGGLWSLPEIIGFATEKNIQQLCARHFKIKTIQFGETLRHTFSHFHLTILPVEINIQSKALMVADKEQIWYNLHSPVSIGLPAPIKFLLDKLL